MFIHITLAGSKFSSGTLPTMHLIYVYTDIYQGLKIFANSCIYLKKDGCVSHMKAKYKVYVSVCVSRNSGKYLVSLTDEVHCICVSYMKCCALYI